MFIHPSPLILSKYFENTVKFISNTPARRYAVARYEPNKEQSCCSSYFRSRAGESDEMAPEPAEVTETLESTPGVWLWVTGDGGITTLNQAYVSNQSISQLFYHVSLLNPLKTFPSLSGFTVPPLLKDECSALRSGCGTPCSGFCSLTLNEVGFKIKSICLWWLSDGVKVFFLPGPYEDHGSKSKPAP